MRPAHVGHVREQSCTRRLREHVEVVDPRRERSVGPDTVVENLDDVVPFGVAGPVCLLRLERRLEVVEVLLELGDLRVVDHPDQPGFRNHDLQHRSGDKPREIDDCLAELERTRERRGRRLELDRVRAGIETIDVALELGEVAGGERAWVTWKPLPHSFATFHTSARSAAAVAAVLKSGCVNQSACALMYW